MRANSVGADEKAVIRVRVAWVLLRLAPLRGREKLPRGNVCVLGLEAQGVSNKTMRQFHVQRYLRLARASRTPSRRWSGPCQESRHSDTTTYPAASRAQCLRRGISILY
jgi:hypothetical protein